MRVYFVFMSSNTTLKDGTSMIDSIKLHIKYIKYLILFYVRGCKINPAKVLFIQQSFYHQVKGLFDKKIFPYLNKIEKGESNYENSLIGSIIELNQKFKETLDDILQSLPPTSMILRMLRTEIGLNKMAGHRDVGSIKRTLPKFREQTREIFVEECSQYSFSLAELLKGVVDEILNDYKEPLANSNINLNLNLLTKTSSIYIPFNEAATYRDILRNLIINAIEACEGKKEDNFVRIEYKTDSGTPDNIEIVIADSGCGMDPETLNNYFKRGFTSGKNTGTGFGIVEEYIEFINRRGEFKISSAINKGTTVRIKLDPNKITGVGKSVYLYEKRNRIVKISVLLILIVVFFFIAGGKKLLFPPTPVAENYIAGFTPTNPHNDNILGEFGSIKIRTEAGNNNPINLSPSSIKIVHEDSVGPVCIDIDEDGVDEMIAVILPPLEDRQILAGTIKCFNPKGEIEWEVAMEYDPALETIYPYPLGENAVLSQMYVMDFNADGKLEIIALANYSNGLTQLKFINGAGDIIQEYIHYGPVKIFEFADHRQNNYRPPVLAGKNRLMDDRLVLARVNIKDGCYQGAPYPKANIEYADEDYYILEEINSAGIEEFSNMDINDSLEFYNCFVIGAEENLYIFQVNDGRLVITPHSVDDASIDYDKRLLGRWWDNLVSDNMVDRKYDEKDLAAIGNVYHWKDGQLELLNHYDSLNTLNVKLRQCGIF